LNISDWLINSQRAYLEVRDGQLIARPQGTGSAQWVYLHKDHDGSIVAIGQEPVAVFVPDSADVPSLKPGQQMWVEVTVPAKGPPRPIRIGIKTDGVLTPLKFE
jgi:hypothetical protein